MVIERTRRGFMFSVVYSVYVSHGSLHLCLDFLCLWVSSVVLKISICKLVDHSNIFFVMSRKPKNARPHEFNRCLTSLGTGCFHCKYFTLPKASLWSVTLWPGGPHVEHDSEGFYFCHHPEHSRASPRLQQQSAYVGDTQDGTSSIMFTRLLVWFRLYSAVFGAGVVYVKMNCCLTWLQKPVLWSLSPFALHFGLSSMSISLFLFHPICHVVCVFLFPSVFPYETWH